MSNLPVSPGGVVLTEGALDQLQAQRLMKAQRFLDEVGKDQTIKIAALNQVVNSAIQHHGLPETDDAPEFIEKCQAVADALTTVQFRQKYTGIKAVFDHLKLKDATPTLEYCAKQHGIELFTDDSKH